MTQLVGNYPRPARVVLEGRYCRLEPLAARHSADLYRASAGAENVERFAYLFDLPPANQAEMTAWVEKFSVSEDYMTWATIDTASGRAEGRQALMRIVEKDGVVELGSVYWGPAMARTRMATETVFLFARYVFEDLGYRRFEWKCNDCNAPSKRSALRFGFTFEGIFRQHMIQKGRNRDTAWFAMIDSEWPRLKAGYEHWLDPANFAPDGTQKTKLEF